MRALALFLLLAVGAAEAATFTWNGGSGGAWSAGGSGWIPAGYPANGAATDSEALFAGAAPANVILSDTVEANRLTFTAGGYSISNGTQIALTGATPTADVSAGQGASIASVLGGASGLTKSGAGTLTLTASNTYSGATTVAAGALQLGNASTNGSFTSGLYSIADGSTLYMNYATAVRAGTGTWSANLRGGGRLLLNSAQPVNATANWGPNSAASVLFDPAFTGALEVVNGRIDSSAAGLGGITGIVIRSGAQFLGWSGTYGVPITIAGSGWGEGGQPGALRTAGGSVATWNGNITLATNSYILAQGNSTYTIGGAITGNYQCDFDAQAGATLIVAPTGAVQNAYGATRIVGSGAVVASNQYAFSTNGLIMSASTLKLNGFSFNFGNLSGSGTIGNFSTNAAAVLTVGSDGTSTAYTGILANGATSSLALVKTGAGTLTLTATNHSYTGGTTINGGTLQLGNGTTNTMVNPGVCSIADGAKLYLFYATAVMPAWSNITSAGTVELNCAQSTDWGNMSMPPQIGGTLRLDNGRMGSNTTNYFGSLTNIDIRSGGQLLFFHGGSTNTYTYPQSFSIAGSGWTPEPGHPGALRVSGETAVLPGPITLTGNAACYTQTTTAGILQMDGTTSLNGYALTLQPSGGNIGVRNVVGSGTITVSTGASSIVLNGDNSAFSGTYNQVGSNGTFFNNVNAGSTGAVWNITGTYLISAINGTIHLGALSGTGGTLGANTGSTITYSVGARGGSTTYSGTIANYLGSTALMKTGAGTLTLTGAKTYTGATTVNGGTLAAVGSFAGPVTVNTGGAIEAGATGLSMPSLSLQDGGAVSVLRTGPSSAIAVTATNGLTLAGTGVVNVVGLPAGAGPFTLIDYSGTIQGGTVDGNLRIGDKPPRSTFALTNNEAGTSVDLFIVDLGEALHWTGAGGGQWDIATSTNWQTAASLTDTMYLQPGSVGDAVQFDDNAAAFAVAVAAAVTPGRMTVTNAVHDYTLGGAAIGGGFDLVKSGAAQLTLSGTNTYTGATVINDGVLSVSSLAPNGAASGIGAGTAVTLNGGTLQYTGGNNGNDTIASQFNRAIAIGAGGGTLDAASGFVFYNGALSGTGTLHLVSSSGANYQWLITGSSPAFSGSLEIGSGSAGSGWLQYRSNAAFPCGTGAVTINGGGTLSTDPGATTPSTFGNHLYLNGGTLMSQGALTTYTGAVAAVAGKTSYLSPSSAANIAISGNIGGSGEITEAGGSFSIQLYGDNSGFSGVYNHTAAGATMFYSAGAGSSNAAWTISGGGRYLAATAGTPTIHMGSLSGPAGNVWNWLAGSTATFSIGALNTSTTYGGLLFDGSGVTALTKVGGGALTLTASNAYSGATIVNAGALVVNGAKSGAGAVTVNSGGALAGSGTVAGAVAVNSGGHIVPGASPGTLTLTGGLTLNDGAVLDLELGESSDKLVLSGGPFTGSNTAGVTLKIAMDSAGRDGTFVLIDWAGATAAGVEVDDFTAVMPADFSGTAKLMIQGKTLTLSLYHGSVLTVR